MKFCNNFLLFSLLIVLFCFQSQAVRYAAIDTFLQGGTTLFFEVTVGNSPTAIDWYSPTNAATLTPATRFQNVVGPLGGQRDLIIGHWDNSLAGSTASIGVITAAAVGSVAFPLNFQGGAYFQYDGIDNLVGGVNTPSVGAVLNTQPGIGSGGNPFGSANGRMDFTFGGRAKYLYITISCDHDVDYYFDAIDGSNRVNTYHALIQDTDDIEEFFIFAFASSQWTSASTFDWTTVVAFQVRIFTARINDATQIEAVDTSFRLLELHGYAVTGSVVQDCLCNGSNQSDFPTALITLTNTGTQQSQSTRTDAFGDFLFTNLVDGSYQICVDAALVRCPTSQRCFTFTLANLIDPTPFLFVLTTTATMVIPPNANLECGTCIDPSQNCLPRAQLTGCSGSGVDITTWTDSTVVSTNGCIRTVSRTWVNPENNQRQTQIITLSDSLPPVITTQAGSLSFPCGSVTTPIGTWVSTNGGAVATDCTAVLWTNNWNGQSSVCGSPVTVTFTASDPCNNSARTTATYTITSSSGPTLSSPATSSSVECDSKGGSDVASFNTWIANRAGANADVSCGNVIWTNNNPSTPIVSGCTSARTVTFTASDSCGQSTQTTATFTIIDTQLPVITRQAAPQTAQCTAGSGAETQFNAWVASHGGATATDNCISNNNNLVWDNDLDDGDIVTTGCSDGITVTFFVIDPCGVGIVSTTSTFTVTDNAPPTITTQASSRTASCSSDINVAYQDFLSSNGGAIANDGCSGTVWSNNGPSTVSSGCNVPVVVTFSVRDSCNNGPVQTTATFTVNDNTPPTFLVPPSNSGIECTSTDIVTSSFRSWLNSNAGAVGDDNCGSGTTISNDFPTSGSPNLGCNAVTSVRFTVRDACNNLSPVQTATFTVTDSTAPQITNEAEDVVQECSTNTQTQYQSFLTARGGATATDTCGTVSWTNDGPTSIQLGCSGSQTVTFTARDNCNNIARTTATFFITDSTPPRIGSNASNRNVECSASTTQSTDLNAWIASNGGASATDNCGGVTWTNNFVALSGGCTQAATVTFTARDTCGLTVQTTATYSVTDSSPPVISPTAQSQSAPCDNTTSDSAFDTWVASHGGARATDLCQSSESLVWTSNAFEAPDNCDSTTVTFTVTDACSLSARTTASFTIVDTTAPTFTVPPASISVECDGLGNQDDYDQWLFTNGGATVTDVCAFFITVTNNAPDSGPTVCGSTPVVFTAADDCGNARTVTAIYTVTDTSAPIILTPAVGQSVQCAPAENTSQVQQWIANRAGATAADICYSTTSLVWSNNFTNLRADGNCGSSATVTFSVRDPCSVQVAQTTATFSIIDSLAPTIVTHANDLELECNVSNAQAITQYVSSRGGATATDSCSAITWTNNFVNPPLPCAAPLLVTFTATDACGNPSTTSGTIVIDDSELPSFTNFPADAIIGCDQFPDTDITGLPGVVDACSSGLEATYSDTQIQEPAEGLCPGDIIYTRTWTTVDNCGNFNSRVQTIVQLIARNTGECTPTECPPCVEIECCSEVQEEVECIPVSCTPVSCNQVPCQAVPCIPQACGVNPTPTRNPAGPVPLPSVIPAPSCEPVYIYVFDDDDVDLYPDDPNNYGQTTSSASFVQISYTLMFVVISLAFFF